MKTSVIAHRGAWKEFNFPQNSLAALKKAIALNCYACEIDVHLTNDGFVVVNHDYDFYDLPIETTNYNVLKQNKLSNGEHLPLLIDFFSEINKQYNTKLLVEIKTSILNPKNRTQLLIDTIVNQLPKDTYSENTEFILFDFESALYLKRVLPFFKVHYLEGDKSAQEIFQNGLNGMDYNFELLLQNSEIITEFNQLNLQTNSWTINDLNVAKTLKSKGLSYITTDLPSLFINEGL
ncbi:glycerophosphodiester phosphodiesterase family protein [Myroides sp. JBRI-B21084]|uniref:glycerophosphodiester phosphodiesterase family protein n=1 Tax=Myroides sp. JBRI-B21084 TaxID=3119977 RepID=UPI0026E44CC5|nr:glycerophosphodiester phosphodiesterase family protein [Paenimyroides cloacae]WKW45675.1 glycerophosphodiester phosphodiesterase family protein [Paenimyroides cloacae]